MRLVDVAIAGAGPAGSTAALALAREGFSVLLLDRAVFPRPKLCGGLLTWKAVRLLERLHGATPADLLAGRVVNTVASSYSLYYRSRLFVNGRLAYPFHLVDRSAFDQFLLDRAVAAGGELRQGCEVRACDSQGLLTTNQGPVRARLVIGADGVHSVIRRLLPVSRSWWRQGLATAMEIVVPRDRSPRCVDHPQLYAGILKAGYGWVFPGQDHMILGICGLPRHTPNFKAAFLDFLQVLGAPDPAGFLRNHPLRGHPLPYGNALTTPAVNNVLLAGDAGGYADPLLGEGIFYALLTGWQAGEAASLALRGRTDAGQDYCRRIRRLVLPEMRGANRLRWLLHGLNLINPQNLGRYFRLRGGVLAEMVHGVRSYDWGRKKDWGF